jgi:hypothetical protein
MIYLDSLTEIPSFDGYPNPGAGYTWFSDDDEDRRAQPAQRRRRQAKD